MQATVTLPATFAPEVTNRAFIETAADMGATARLNGESIESNPFVPDSPVFDAFVYGWNAEPDSPVATPSPLPLSAETAADLAELATSDNPHVADLARNIRDWLNGAAYAPAAVIASASILANNFALRLAAGDAARDLLGQMEKSAADADEKRASLAAAWRQAAALSQADKTQLRGSPFAAARICARYLDAIANRGDPADPASLADLASLADAICELERRASEKHNEARESTESLHRKTQSLTDSRAIVERLTGEVATYRAQRDSEGARAESYKAAWDRLAKSLSGMTLGQLPADSYGADVAASYLAGKRDLAEAAL